MSGISVFNSCMFYHVSVRATEAVVFNWIWIVGKAVEILRVITASTNLIWQSIDECCLAQCCRMMSSLSRKKDSKFRHYQYNEQLLTTGPIRFTHFIPSEDWRWLMWLCMFPYTMMMIQTGLNKTRAAQNDKNLWCYSVNICRTAWLNCVSFM